MSSNFTRDNNLTVFNINSFAKKILFLMQVLYKELK